MDVKEVIGNQPHLTIPERQITSKILTERLSVFQVKRIDWKVKPLHLELRPGPEPIAVRPFPAPQSYRKLVKEEIDRLVEIGLLTPFPESKWTGLLLKSLRKTTRLDS